VPLSCREGHLRTVKQTAISHRQILAARVAYASYANRIGVSHGKTSYLGCVVVRAVGGGDTPQRLDSLLPTGLGLQVAGFICP